MRGCVGESPKPAESLLQAQPTSSMAIQHACSDHLRGSVQDLGEREDDVRAHQPSSRKDSVEGLMAKPHQQHQHHKVVSTSKIVLHPHLRPHLAADREAEGRCVDALPLRAQKRLQNDGLVPGAPIFWIDLHCCRKFQVVCSSWILHPLVQPTQIVVHPGKPIASALFRCVLTILVRLDTTWLCAITSDSLTERHGKLQHHVGLPTLRSERLEHDHEVNGSQLLPEIYQSGSCTLSLQFRPHLMKVVAVESSRMSRKAVLGMTVQDFQFLSLLPGLRQVILAIILV
mmetsp:Transcript_45194/g.113681  ORF Transcript_45194/g.113681 Transcript_45194/m.113681 type:complete len:286 (-) Transcript_45194:224-1081(-)